MISNPKFGWCNFNIENFHGTPSYLTDVPIDLLKCFISYFKDNVGTCTFDEEGHEFSLVLTTDYAYMLSHDEDDEIILISTSIKDLANELIKDIESNMDEWIIWPPCFEDFTEKEKLERIVTLKKYIFKLEKLLITAELEENK